LVVALGAAVAVLVLIGAVILLAGPFGTEETAPVVTEPPAVVTTIPVVRRPEELVPTGVYLLTDRPDYEHVVVDSSGLIWAGGDGHLARLDPVTGETRVWTHSDDDAFAQGVRGLAPALRGGVWMMQEESVRWFDGERFRDVVEAPPMMPGEDLDSVVEAPDGSLWASTFERGLFRWDGSSWSHIDDARPVIGAGALAVDADGTVWVGNVELPSVGEYWRPLGRGVSRYDGESWENFTSNDAAVLAGHVRTIDPRSDGTVWVGTARGAARFDGASWVSFDAAETGLRGWISAAVGPDGTVWAAAARESLGAVDVASYDGQTWFVYGTETGLPADTGWLIATPIATERDVFVGTGAGLFQLDGDRWTRVSLVSESADPATAPKDTNVPLAGVEGLQAFDDFLWVWGEDEIWRYSAGTWSPYATTPGDLRDLTYTSDTLWALTDAGLHYLEADAWQLVTRVQAWSIAAEPDTGIVWVSTGTDLYRWDGTEMTTVGPPGDESYVGQIAVTSDGTVWTGGLFGYMPWLGDLGRYNDDTGTWEVIRPLGGDDNSPASSLTPTSDGDLWVVLPGFFEDWEAREAAGQPTAAPVLAHHDGTTGEWTVYDEDLPDGYHSVMASGSDSVWIARGGGVAGFEGFGGLLRFDGQTWTTYLEDTPVDDTVDALAVAADGTIWYSINGVLRRLEP
jgi:ligand-binding sensor domain-containing protein